jgi:putative transposase
VHFLERKGISLSKTTVHKYMNKDLEFICICRRERPGYKRGSAHELFPNHLNQDFRVIQKSKVWCADFTYLKLTNSLFRYNCSIFDLHERYVAATSTGKWLTGELTIET